MAFMKSSPHTLWIALAAAFAGSFPRPAPASEPPSLSDRAPGGRPSPAPAIWITPTLGSYGSALGIGTNLRMAWHNGWGAALDVAAGEEMCILCGHIPETFISGAALAGYRSVGRVGYMSMAFGPNLGAGERTEPGTAGRPDPSCTDEDISCPDLPARSDTFAGLGVQLQAEAAFAGRYAGIGGRMHMILIEDRALFGLSLIVPVGRIR